VPGLPALGIERRDLHDIGQKRQHVAALHAVRVLEENQVVAVIAVEDSHRARSIIGDDGRFRT
jgi:hypothetical protein